MGTNVYAYKVDYIEKVKELKKTAIDRLSKSNDKVVSIKDILDSLIYDLESIDENYKIHLGKRSSGWKFLWEQNPLHYGMSRKSINEFLSRDDIIIIDEYGEEYNVEMFWKDFGDCDLTNYEHSEWNEYYGRPGIGKESIFGVTEEGLRYAKFSNFS